MYLKLLLIGALAAGIACAQDQGGGGGGGGGMGGGGGRGGGGGGNSLPSVQAQPTPLDRMAALCTLSKDQKKQFSAILDAASKSAVDLRKQIPADRQALEAAVQAGKIPDEIKKLEEADGQAMAQMTQIEMKAFVDLYKLLDPDQRKAGGQRIFSMLGGMFFKKNWND
jgi:Spy/CpxP family protein refolding chaperone